MLMTGKEYLDSIRDGRRVYIGGELVEDVTTHPAFRNAAQSFAMNRVPHRQWAHHPNLRKRPRTPTTTQ